MPRSHPEIVETKSAFLRPREASAAGAARLIEEVRDALELAIVSGAPAELVDRLALSAGLLLALADLGGDGPPLLALTSTTRDRAAMALATWRAWQRGMLTRTG